MNTKAKGSRLERDVKSIFERLGYDVAKTGGSFGNYDLYAVAKKDGIRSPVVIQVKANKISKQEKDKIADDNIRALKEIWVKKDGQSWSIFRWLGITNEWIQYYKIDNLTLPALYAD